MKKTLGGLTIGGLAKAACVSAETIRYYHRIGLLIEPEKPHSGYRHYPASAVARIRFIKRAQQLGFTLKEISELLSLDGGHCDNVRKMAEQKCQLINTQIKDLLALHNALENLVKGCRTESSAQHCSLIDAIANEPD